MKYIIIGNGFAGINAIEAIRENDKKGEIILISDEKNYSRPLISYYLKKRIRASALPYRDSEFFSKNEVNLKIGSRVEVIDPIEKIVSLTNGESFKFDKLLIATGGTPILPPIEGNTSKGVFSFTTYENARHIEDFIANNSVESVVILGGGLIGLKATEALMDLGLHVIVVELADRILSATFDRKASEIIEKALRLANCDVLTGDTISLINSVDDHVNSVSLKSGRILECQMVIIAIGVRPSIEILKNTNIKCEKGVVVSESMETSMKDIYAAGDVCQVNGWAIAILPLAVRQGKIAGNNMSITCEHNRMIYSGSLPMNSVTLANIPTISVGLTDPKENAEYYEILQKYNPKKKTYRKIILEENIIVGAIFVNEIDRAGIFTGMIKDQVDTTPFKAELMKDTFGLISLPRNYRKHLVKGPSVEI